MRPLLRFRAALERRPVIAAVAALVAAAAIGVPVRVSRAGTVAGPSSIARDTSPAATATR